MGDTILDICQNISLSDRVNSNDSISDDKTTSAPEKSQRKDIIEDNLLTHFKLGKLKSTDVFTESVREESM